MFDFLKRNKPLMAAHKQALQIAQETYDKYKGQDSVITQGEGPGYTFVSAAGPERVAWDEYFYAMQDLGFSAWGTKKRFDKELKT